jgi:hypothetical protein
MQRKYQEFTAMFIEETDPISGNHLWKSQPLTIDLNSIVSFNADLLGGTEVRLADGSAFTLKVSYDELKEIMSKETQHEKIWN